MTLGAPTTEPPPLSPPPSAERPVPGLATSAQAVVLIDEVEHSRRMAAIAAVDALERIDATRAFRDHGHGNARIMFAHVSGTSTAESLRLDRIRRMIGAADQIRQAWHRAELSVSTAAVLGRAYANPRTQHRFLLDQAWFLKKARRYGPDRLTKIIANWLDLHDDSGPDPEPDPSHARRRATLTQDHFTKTWTLQAELGSLQGSALNQTLQAYTDAEFHHDWTQAQATHGTDTCRDHLARTETQRRADALCQIAADATNSDKPSAPVERVHNIVWTAETYEELLRRWVDAPGSLLEADTYNIADIDGHPIAASAAFANSLIATVRRVIQNAAGVTINMGTRVRLFTGLTRLGVNLATTECYWPGCHVPTSRCQVDHLRPAARGGPTDQSNGLPACKHHNRLKQRGYTVTRQPDGTITITAPNGDNIHDRHPA